MAGHTETLKIDPSSYIQYSDYHIQGDRRVARFAPQMEYAPNQISSIPRPIHFQPPANNRVAGYYPSHMVFPDEGDSQYCSMNVYYNGQC